MIIRLQDNPKVIVQPDQSTIIYTGNTLTSAIGSGATTVSINGNQMIIYTATGGTANWGNIFGTLSDQTDLQNALTAKLNITDTKGGYTQFDYTYDDATYWYYDMKLSTIVDNPPFASVGDDAGLRLGNTQIDLALYTGGTNISGGNIKLKRDYSYISFIPRSGEYTSLTLYDGYGLFYGGPLSYNTDRSAEFNDNSLINKKYVEDNFITSAITSTKLDISTFQTYTGTTAPAQFAPIDATDDMWTSGQTITWVDSQGYITGVTGYVTTTDFNVYTGATDTRISSIEDDITTIDSQIIYLSGQTDLRLKTSDFNTYSGNTATLIQANTDNFDNYVPASGGSFTGLVQGTSLQLSGDLTVNGTMHIINTEQIYTENDFIYMRSGATSGLGVGEVSGIAALNVDGLDTTAVMGVTNDGLIRVGWSGDTLQAVATREDAPIDLGIAIWSDSENEFVTTGKTMTELINDLDLRLLISDYNTYTGDTETRLQGIEADVVSVSGLTQTNANDISQLNTDFNTHTGDTNIHYAQSAITITQSQVTDLVSDLSDLNTGITANTASINANYVEFTGFSATTESQIDYISGVTDTKASKTLNLTTVSTTGYTVSSTDSNEMLEFTNTGTTIVTLPTGLGDGFQVSFFNLSGGTVTFTGGTGTSIISKGSATGLNTQYAGAAAYYRSNYWRLIGSLD